MTEVDREEFEELVTDAVHRLPQEFQESLENVAIIVEDEPTEEHLKRGFTRNLLGLYIGVPLDRRYLGLSGFPARVFLFRLPICSICGDLAAVREQVHETVIHEVGHHFGFSEDEVQREK